MTYTRTELITNLHQLMNEYANQAAKVSITTLAAYYEGKSDGYRHALEMVQFKPEPRIINEVAPHDGTDEEDYIMTTNRPHPREDMKT